MTTGFKLGNAKAVLSKAQDLASSWQEPPEAENLSDYILSKGVVLDSETLFQLSEKLQRKKMRKGFK